MSAIEVTDLIKNFKTVSALNRLSFSVNEGEAFAMLGPDGAGKTTLSRILAGILIPTSGKALVGGFRLPAQSEKVKRIIGYMPQNFGLYGDLTVAENIDFYADIYGIPENTRKDQTQKLLEFTALAPFTRRLARNLSGGMKQKLALCCALIHVPKILILDEPTLGVDPVSRREFWIILYELLAQSVTLFLTTSYMDEAMRCHRVALMDRGNVLISGPPETVTNALPGKMVEIVCDEAARASEILRSLECAEMVTLYGDSIHVMCDDEATARENIRIELDKRSIPFQRISTIPPSLEDTFIFLIEKQRRENEQQ